MLKPMDYSSHLHTGDDEWHCMVTWSGFSVSLRVHD